MGGKRGTAAGLIRVIYEFITQYDRSALKQLQTDIAGLQGQDAAYQKAIEKNSKEQIALTARLKDANGQLAAIKKQAASAGIIPAGGIGPKTPAQYAKDELKELNSLIGAEGKIEKQRKQKKAYKADELALDKQAQAFAAKSQFFTLSQVRDLMHEKSLNASIVDLKAKGVALGEKQSAVQSEINQRTKLTNAISSYARELPGKLGSLALGALSSITVGAAIGVGFEAVQVGMDAVANWTKDIIDPARHAKEAMKGLGDEVRGIADKDSISRLQAAQKLIESLGKIGTSAPSTGKPTLIASLVAEAAALDTITQNLDKYESLQLSTSRNDLVKSQLIERYTKDLLARDSAYQALKTRSTSGDRPYAEQNALNSALLKTELIDRQIATDAINAELATVDAAANAQAMADAFNSIRLEAITNQIQAAADAADATARAAIDANNAAIQAAADNSNRVIEMNAGLDANKIQFEADKQVAALQAKSDALTVVDSARTKRLQAALDALDNAGPSLRTRQLTAALKALNDQEDRRAYLLSLSNANEEIYLLKLQHRLETQQAEIKISDYSGKARIVALDAAIFRLQKEGDQQDRLNAALDLQYRMSQRIGRNEGETIQTYLLRRAQETRALYSEQADQERNDRIQQLNDEKDAVQYRLDLKDLLAQKSELIRQHDLDLERQSLQDRLDASTKADSDALDHRRKTLQKELEASQRADQAALKSKQDAIAAEIRDVQEKARVNIEIVQANAAAQEQSNQEIADKAIAANNAAFDLIVAKRKIQTDLEIALATQADVKERQMAIQQASTLGDLSLVSGGLAGSAFAFQQLKAQILSLGMSDAVSSELLNNAAALMVSYRVRLLQLSTRGYAEGGVFNLKNSMNFGKNIRAGERGEEIGVILSNKVTQALRDQERGPVISNVNLSSYDPYRDLYRLKKVVREVVREEL
jgi:hypothetical protein